MKSIHQSIHRHLPMIENADRFICFATVWWDGAGLDAVVWWETAGRFSQAVAVTGETIDPKVPNVSIREISSDEFELLMRDFSAFGVGAIPDQTNPIRLTHFTDWYGLKTGQDEPRWTYVTGGKHHDDRVDGWTDWVHQRCPALLSV